MNENIVDKRVYKTLTKIENGMIRLLEDKPYKDINVKDKDDFLYQYQKEMIKKAQARIHTCLC